MASNSMIGTFSDEEDLAPDILETREQDAVDNLESHQCDIFPYLEHSMISGSCFGDLSLLSAESKEQETLILKRCGIFEENDQVIDLQICKRHLDRLGKFFKSRFVSPKVCLWKDHKASEAKTDGPAPKRKKLTPRKNPNARYRVVDEEKSRLIYKEVNIKSGLYILRRYENYIFVVLSLLCTLCLSFTFGSLNKSLS